MIVPNVDVTRRDNRRTRPSAAADAPRPSPLLILEEIPAPAASPVERDPNAPNFDPRYRFETFVVGKANEVACTAAKTLASADTDSFNPLFIHGGTGRGKTYLLHAIGQDFLARRPSARERFRGAARASTASRAIATYPHRRRPPP